MSDIHVRNIYDGRGLVTREGAGINGHTEAAGGLGAGVWSKKGSGAFPEIDTH